MKTDITDAQIEAYRTNGFLVIDDFLSPTELTRWREVTDGAVAGRGTNKIANQDTWRDEDGFYDKVFVQRINLWMDDEQMRDVMLDPALGEMMATLAGVDGIRIWHDQALIKSPWSNPTAWHLDNPFWSFFSRDAISIWVALDDATLQNGCLYYLPGTHRTASFDNVDLEGSVGDLFSTYESWVDQEPIAAAMNAGSCVVHNGLIPHAAGPNMTPRPRRAMTCAYMPDGATFNGRQSVLPTPYVETLSEGDVIDDDRYVPLIYRRADGDGEGDGELTASTVRS